MNPLLNEARRLRLKKRFGQHFLVDADALSRIADALAITPGDRVMEIGPGSGFLTEQLLARGAQTLAIEIDRRLSEFLQRKFAQQPTFTLITADALAFDFVAACAQELPQTRIALTGNLPYNIATPLLFRLCGDVDDPEFPLRRRVSQLTLMLQAEVADRLTASPGCKAYGVLGLMLAPWWQAEETLALGPTAFYPPPKVCSKVVTLRPRAASLVPVAHAPTYARLVRAAFGQRRKTLRNALAAHLPAPLLSAMLEALSADHGALASLRPDAIALAAYAAMAHWLDTQKAPAIP